MFLPISYTSTIFLLIIRNKHSATLWGRLYFKHQQWGYLYIAKRSPPLQSVHRLPQCLLMCSLPTKNEVQIATDTALQQMHVASRASEPLPSQELLKLGPFQKSSLALWSLLKFQSSFMQGSRWWGGGMTLQIGSCCLKQPVFYFQIKVEVGTLQV